MDAALEGHERVAPAALADVVAALKNTLRSSDVSASARDAALVEFAQRLVDKYLLGAATTSSDDVFRAIKILSSFATQYPQAFGYGEPARAGHAVLGLLEQLPRVATPKQGELVQHALRTLLLLLRAADARAFATLGGEVVQLLAAPAGADEPAPALRFPGFSDACGLSAPAGGREAASGGGAVRRGLLQLAAAMHADAPQFLGDGGPALWAALHAELEAASSAPDAAAARAVGVEEAVAALRTLLRQHPAPPPVRYRLLHTLLPLLCLGLTPASQDGAASADAARGEAGGGGGGDGGANGGGGGGGGENGSGGDGSGVSDQITIAKMGVVIQLMVVPVSSGVIFTVDPRAVEQTTTMLVEAVHGLGEGIVSGEITPHSFSVDIATAAVRAQNKTKQMVKVSTNLDKEVSGIATVPTTETEQATPPISEAALLRLCCAGRAVAIHYGTPQDLVSTNTITNTITNTNKHKYKPVNHVRKRAHIADSYFATLTHRSSGRSR